MIHFVIWLFLLCSIATAIEHPFDQYTLMGKEDGDTLLVIGGVHGDEPGGYFAPALLVRHYTIQKGNLIVVPNLNFDSILENKRGIYGDMNRKFSTISSKDEDFDSVARIKDIILQKDIDLVLNLHDGHGFYRQTWESIIFNPKAWGQSFIIDQQSIESAKYSNLGELAQKVAQRLNNNLFEKHHSFSVKNTKTKFKDEQMQLSLTYFAITHNKPALAIETSKNIKELPEKVTYQLSAIEAFMNELGIVFERSFELNRDTIEKMLQDFGTVRINDTIEIDLSSVRSFVNFVPMKKTDNTFVFSHPLGCAKESSKQVELYVGNQKIANLKKDPFDISSFEPKITIIADGKKIDASTLFEITIKEKFLIQTQDDVRVNVIGYVGKGSEDNVEISYSELAKRFSLDEKEKIFRAEFYKDGKFIKTINLNFKE